MQETFDFSDADPAAAQSGPVRAQGVARGGSPLPDGAAEATLEQALDAAAQAATRGAVIVTVNRRLARHLTEAFVRRRIAAGELWWETPVILPLGNWLETLHDTALASGASLRVRLGPLAARRRWRAIVAARHAMLLDVDAAAREAARAWRLAHLWHCLPDEQAYLSSDAHAFRGWAASYRTALEAGHLVDEATLLDHLVDLIAAGGVELPSRVVLAGFLQPPPAIGALAEALTVAGTTVATLADGETTAAPVRRVLPDDTLELRTVADALWQAVDARPDGTFGVIVPDLESRRAEVRRAFDRRFFPSLSPAAIQAIERPYDVSVGESLADTPTVRTALLALRLAWRGLDRQGIATLLLSPHLTGGAEEARERERLERKLRDWRVRHMGLSALRRRLGEHSALYEPLGRLGRRIGAARRDGRESTTLGDWAERFSAALAAFGWPGSGLGSDEYQSVQALHGVLDDLQTLDDGTPVELGEALGDVARLARERVFQPETPAVPIRILGRLESHGQRFDALWVVGLDSERWPAAGAPTPFLSVADQRAAGMPEACPEARLAVAQRELAHWCRSASEVSLSAARERDGQPLVPSAALAGAALAGFDDSAFDPAARVRDAVTLERIADALAPTVAPGDAIRGGARLFQDQAECPFRAFARHRLAIKPLEEVDIGVDARRGGTLLHRALELFWRETVDHATLMSLGADALDARIDTAVGEAFAEDEFLDATVATLERARLAALLREWIEGREMDRAPFTVEAFEQKIELEHGGIAVNLTIDRIDRIGDHRVVIDYKSGRNDSIASWSDERISSPQLPLYALSNEAIDGVAFARVARGDCRFLGIAADEGLLARVGPEAGDESPAGWPAWRAHWQASLDAIAGEVAGGVASVTPMDGACRFCELRPVCRHVDGATSTDDAGAADGSDTDGAA